MTKQDNTDADGGMIAVSPLYPNLDVLTVIGEVCFLCFHSTLYRHWSMQTIGRVFEPPIYLKQFQIYRARGVPRGLVTWAKLDAAAEEKHLHGGGLDTFEEWRSGDQFWIMDLMAPWGHGRTIIKNVLDTVPVDEFKTLRVKNDRRSVVTWQRSANRKKWTTKRCRIS
ncbi:toxin-activating lysine-acyltransferase [Yoonia sp. 2307UL14-13]|uniref:toxin-activating lysine-acyltransferase n=1 Tax=Yoonia sp. 2307UL14-13 TaxID=3126506 RepID=UPI00309CD82A